MTLLGDRRQRVVLRSVRQACSGGSQPLGQHRGAHVHGAAVRLLQQTPPRVRHPWDKRKR